MDTQSHFRSGTHTRSSFDVRMSRIRWCTCSRLHSSRDSKGNLPCLVRKAVLLPGIWPRFLLVPHAPSTPDRIRPHTPPSMGSKCRSSRYFAGSPHLRMCSQRRLFVWDTQHRCLFSAPRCSIFSGPMSRKRKCMCSRFQHNRRSRTRHLNAHSRAPNHL